MRLTNTFAGKKDGIRARCAPRSTPLRLPLRHNRPLPAPSRLLPPLTSPSRALGTLAKLTSVTEITGYGPGLQLIIRNIALFGQWPVSLGNGVLVRLRSGGLRHFVDGFRTIYFMFRSVCKATQPASISVLITLP